MKFFFSITLQFHVWSLLAQTSFDTLVIHQKKYLRDDDIYNRCTLISPIEHTILSYIALNNNILDFLGANDTTTTKRHYRIIIPNNMAFIRNETFGCVSLVKDCDYDFIGNSQWHYVKNEAPYIPSTSVYDKVPYNFNTGLYRDILISLFEKKKDKYNVGLFVTQIKGNPPYRTFYFKIEFTKLPTNKLIVTSFTTKDATWW